MIKNFDVKKLKYLKGAIESGMSDDKIVDWIEKNFTTEDLLEIVKIILADRDSLLKQIESK